MPSRFLLPATAISPPRDWAPATGRADEDEASFLPSSSSATGLADADSASSATVNGAATRRGRMARLREIEDQATETPPDEFQRNLRRLRLRLAAGSVAAPGPAAASMTTRARLPPAPLSERSSRILQRWRRRGARVNALPDAREEEAGSGRSTLIMTQPCYCNNNDAHALESLRPPCVRQARRSVAVASSFMETLGEERGNFIEEGLADDGDDDEDDEDDEDDDVEEEEEVESRMVAMEELMRRGEECEGEVDFDGFFPGRCPGHSSLNSSCPFSHFHDGGSSDIDGDSGGGMVGFSGSGGEETSFLRGVPSANFMARLSNIFDNTERENGALGSMNSAPPRFTLLRGGKIEEPALGQ